MKGNLLREKRKGSKPISPPGGTSEMSHSAILLMDTEDHHRGQTAVKLLLTVKVDTSLEWFVDLGCNEL